MLSRNQQPVDIVKIRGALVDIRPLKRLLPLFSLKLVVLLERFYPVVDYYLEFLFLQLDLLATHLEQLLKVSDQVRVLKKEKLKIKTELDILIQKPELFHEYFLVKVVQVTQTLLSQLLETQILLLELN